MSGDLPIPFETEPTPIGEQTLISGVRRVSIYERLMVLAAQPLGPKKSQKPCDLGLIACPPARVSETGGMKWRGTKWTCSAPILQPERTNHHGTYAYPPV
jgi:hypothetical protein